MCIVLRYDANFGGGTAGFWEYFVKYYLGIGTQRPPGWTSATWPALAAASGLVRFPWPVDRWTGFLGFIQMEPAHLPQYLSLFIVGVRPPRALPGVLQPAGPADEVARR